MSSDEYRALLTEREQEILTGDADVSESYYYRVVTRVRQKVERVERDLQILDDHHDTLGDELRGVVCSDHDDAVAEQDRADEPGDGSVGDTPTADTTAPADVLDAVDAADADPGAGTDGAAIPGAVGHDDAALAVAAARDYIRDHGGATKKDLVKNVMPEHTLGYDVEDALAKIDGPDRYRGAWWRTVVSPSLKKLDDVQTPPQGASTWRYTGEIRT